MKRFFLSLGVLMSFMLLFSTGIQAQKNSDQKQITVIQKVTADDGSVSVKKKRFDAGESPETYIEELQLDESGNQKMELTILTDGGSEEDAETILFIRSGNGEEEVIIRSNGDFDSNDFDFDFDDDFDFDFDFDNDFNFDCDDKGAYQHHHEYHYGNHHSKKSKALIGIYPERVEGGVLVTSLVYGGGARAAGIEPGDVMTAIDGKSLAEDASLTKTMLDYEPGDVISVDFIRDGQAMNTSVTLTERGKTNKRNPCKVFIGVSLGSSSGEGIRISGIIDGWPAEEMALESGDRILAMDGVRVEDFDELLTERNKHQPGDEFVLTVLREGETFDAVGVFKSCPEENITTPQVVEPAPEPQPEEGQGMEIFDNFELELGGFNAYPNPTAGMLNVRFRGEPVPTIVTVTDINGQQLFIQQLDDFDGYFAQEIDLSKGTPGTVTITVRQGDQVQSKQVVLLSRA